MLNSQKEKIFLTDLKYFHFFEDMILAFAVMKCFLSFLTFVIPVSYHQNMKLIKLFWFLWNWLHSLNYCTKFQAAELYDYNIFLISTTCGDFWRKFDITILVHPYTTGIKPDYFMILHQFSLSKPCSFYWGLLQWSNPDLITSSWIPSFAYASDLFYWMVNLC